MQTVVETPGYLKAAEAIFTQAERDQIVSVVAADPECGEVIQGTGGFRKVRVARGGMGKRGGARVIYIHEFSDLSHDGLRQKPEREPFQAGTQPVGEARG